MTDAVAVIGAGSWGTALADLLARKGMPVRIWAYEKAVADAINREHENPHYLPGTRLSANLEATNSVREAVDGCGTVVSVSPAQHVREVMDAAAPSIKPGTLVVSASKGIEKGTLDTMAEILDEVLPDSCETAFLSGPSFAAEVARGLATAVTVASQPRRSGRAARTGAVPDRILQGLHQR